MTFDQAHAIIRRLTYKVGWTFTCLPDGPETMIIRVKSYEPDSTGQTGELIPILLDRAIVLTNLYPDRLIAKVRSILEEREIHEMDEWLKLDGKVINDPHQ